jgi:mannitol operon transcriptional antiterminator
VVRYNLDSVESYLAAGGLRLERRRGVGVWVSGDDDRRLAVRAALDTTPGPRLLDTDDRRHRVQAELLDAAPGRVLLSDLEAMLGASRPTVRRDVRAVEPWLDRHHLHLQRMPGLGIAVRGTELNIRKALLALVLESVGDDVLARLMRGSDRARTAADDTADGLRGFARDLDLPTHRDILARSVPDLDDGGSMATIATLYLAIATRRVRAGDDVDLQSGQFRSLIEHPVADASTRIAAAIEAELHLRVADHEVAAITEFLLGSVELVGATLNAEPDDWSMVDRLMASAGARLHPALVDDEQLRRNLGEHLRRLRVRLRYGLPVSNPLDHEVRARYPDVYAIAADIVGEMTAAGDNPVPADEIGFLTMYLAGSLERNRLRPKIRVTVVCPSGMATAWILVSRLMAEFPQLEIVRVVSKTAFEVAEGDPESDLVVSTVPIEDGHLEIPTVVVSPLVRELDLKRLRTVLGEATH